MNKMLFKLGVGVLALAGLTWPLAAAVPEKTLPGHVPSIVSTLAKSGDLPATNELKLAIGLQVRNEAALDDLVNQVSDPASPNYHHYLTPAQFTDQFAPTEQDYQAVIDFAKSQGLTVTRTHANRMLIEVTWPGGQCPERVQSEPAHLSASDREPQVLRAGYGTQCAVKSGDPRYQRPE